MGVCFKNFQGWMIEFQFSAVGRLGYKIYEYKFINIMSNIMYFNKIGYFIKTLNTFVDILI